jgi:hypothetical protein
MSYLSQLTVNSTDMYEIKMIYSDQLTPGQLRFMECIVNKNNLSEVHPIIERDSFYSVTIGKNTYNAFNPEDLLNQIN